MEEVRKALDWYLVHLMKCKQPSEVKSLYVDRYILDNINDMDFECYWHEEDRAYCRVQCDAIKGHTERILASSRRVDEDKIIPPLSAILVNLDKIDKIHGAVRGGETWQTFLLERCY
eukprot:TRINITY_DN33862_c0_g1_i1.p1 TRINITY_DN33862_c0_g1~~TRINITY_DN33862_c0_g1_i1.p1  ORF type:complete len:117 (-),score=21.13 TRINITY_DN33862_c0_g1_i1:27-377(-)